jgi:predicted TIM-barrel fold metal-dependent hydrolase
MNEAPVIVDLHVHIFPERIFRAVWKYFETFAWDVHHEETEQIAKTLEAHGVCHGVGLTYAHKPGIAMSMNRYMARIGETLPFFIPFGTVFPDDDDFRETVDFAINSPQIHGFKFQPLVQCFDVNDPRLDYLYGQCVESSTPIVMHIGSGPYANEYVGFPYFSRLMKRFPELRICVPHMGVTEYDDFLFMMDDHPNMFLDTTMINTRTDVFDNRYSGNPARLLRHTDRICFGSDWPNVPYPYQEALDSIHRFGFPEDAIAKILGENALRFLNRAAG